MTRLFFISFFLLQFGLFAQNKLSHADSVQKIADTYYKSWIEENANRQAAGLKPLPLKDTSFNLGNGQAVTAVDPVDIRTNPEFPGGLGKAKEFIEKNLIKPKDMVLGKVFIRVIILETGLIANPTVMKGLNSSCNKAAIDVINKLPKFKPALDRNNKPTSCDMYFPVVFN